MSLSAVMVLLEPASQPAGGHWLDPWLKQPEFLIPIGLGLLMLMIVLGLKARDWPSQWRARGRQTLDPEQLEELMLGTAPNILDVRSEPEFRGHQGHIRSAVNIPFSQLEHRLDELDTSHPRPVVLVDETDVLSHQAYPLVAARGHPWLYVLKGGMKAWRRAKMPTYQVTEKKPH